MRFLKYLCVGLVLMGFSGVAARAEVEVYDFDQAHTQILFFVDHLGFATSQGEFHQVDGTFSIDRAHPPKSSIDVSIPTSSVDMDTEKWNAHLQGKDFFDVENHPVMTFKSTGIEMTSGQTSIVTGDLTLLGVTKPVAMEVKHNKSGKHTFSGKYVAGFSATTSVKRSDFGMKFGLPLIGDDIEIRLEIEGIRRGGDLVNP